MKHELTTIKSHKGFSLIELMTVVAIIGIMTTAAIAAYNQYSQRVADEYGKIILQEVIAAQKIAFIHNRKFFLSFKAIGFDSETVKSQYDYFSVTLSLCAGVPVTRCVVATATPTTNKTTGKIFSVDSTGDWTETGGVI